MVEAQQASGGGLVGLATYFFNYFVTIPSICIWLSYVTIIVMLIACLVSLITR